MPAPLPGFKHFIESFTMICMKSILIDLSGRRFGRLNVLRQGPRTRPKVPKWFCLCDCGNITNVDGKSLRFGLSTSCGCKKKELAQLINKTHGLTDSPEYKTWCGIKRRCLNKNDKAYPRYGGRGIRICEQWKDSFETFYADIGPRPSDAHSIERLNPNGDYEPGNCIWLLLAEQNFNRRDTIYLVVDGVRTSLTELSKESDVPYPTIQARIARGWDHKRAVTEPVKTKYRHLT